MKLEAISMSRYNGGVAAKRRYGSATLTDFMVIDRDNPATRLDIKSVGGATPGERKTRALQIAAEKLRGGATLAGPSWRKQAPKTIRERGSLRNRCGGKCFLQPKTLAFPVCAKNSCKVSCDGLRAAFSRARQFRRSKVARLALIRACHMRCPWTKRRGRCER